MSIHVVQRGEILSTIARRYGFKSYQAIYDHPKNAELKRRRPDPNLIFPGDELYIPPRPEEPKRAACSTGSKHTFQVKLRTKRLRIFLRDPHGSLLRDEPFRLDLPGAVIEERTNGEGLLDVPLPEDAAHGVLTVRDHRYRLAIGDLNPIDDTPDEGVSGAQGRLANLGYDVGPSDGLMGPRTRAAIRAFQRDFRLKRTGRLDRQTLDKLKERHRS